MSPPEPPLEHGRPLLGALGRAPVVSVVATLADMAVLTALVELVGVHYVLATTMGATVGAALHFAMSRHWVFLAQDDPMRAQLPAYVAVVASSIFWTTVCVWAFTDLLGLPYLVSKVAAAAVVLLCHNFPLMRWVVFRPRGRG